MKLFAYALILGFATSAHAAPASRFAAKAPAKPASLRLEQSYTLDRTDGTRFLHRVKGYLYSKEDQDYFGYQQCSLTFSAASQIALEKGQVFQGQLKLVDQKESLNYEESVIDFEGGGLHVEAECHDVDQDGTASAPTVGSMIENSKPYFTISK